MRWNGTTVGDPAAHFVPPRAAYTPQVPRLFSERLRDNILMGLPDDGRLAHALHVAVLTPDIATLEAGLEPFAGPRLGVLEMFRDYYANAWDEAKLRRHLAAPVAVRDRVELEERLARLVERGEPR